MSTREHDDSSIEAQFPYVRGEIINQRKGNRRQDIAPIPGLPNTQDISNDLRIAEKELIGYTSTKQQTKRKDSDAKAEGATSATRKDNKKKTSTKNESSREEQYKKPESVPPERNRENRRVSSATTNQVVPEVQMVQIKSPDAVQTKRKASDAKAEGATSATRKDNKMKMSTINESIREEQDKKPGSAPPGRNRENTRISSANTNQVVPEVQMVQIKSRDAVREERISCFGSSRVRRIMLPILVYSIVLTCVGGWLLREFYRIPGKNGRCYINWPMAMSSS